LPKEFCLYALSQTNDNIEEAASWAFDHFEAWSNEQARAQTIIEQSKKRMVRWHTFFSGYLNSLQQPNISQIKTAIEKIDYPGEAYSFVDDMRHLPPRALPSTNITVVSLKPGVRCTVSERATEVSDFCGWVDQKYRVYAFYFF
jgi:hypothetical protein